MHDRRTALVMEVACLIPETFEHDSMRSEDLDHNFHRSTTSIYLPPFFPLLGVPQHHALDHDAVKCPRKCHACLPR